MELFFLFLIRCNSKPEKTALLFQTFYSTCQLGIPLEFAKDFNRFNCSTRPFTLSIALLLLR